MEKRLFKNKIRNSLLNKLSSKGLIALIHKALYFDILDEVVDCVNCDHKVVDFVMKTYLDLEDFGYESDYSKEAIHDIMAVAPIFYNRHLKGTPHDNS